MINSHEAMASRTLYALDAEPKVKLVGKEDMIYRSGSVIRGDVHKPLRTTQSPTLLQVCGTVIDGT